MEYDHLQFCHLVNGVCRAFLAHPAVFQASIRHHVSSPLWGCIDVQISGMDLLREPHRPIHVLREYSGGKPKAGIVGFGDCIVNVFERADGNGRAEQFFPGNQHVRKRVGNHRRRVQRTLAISAGDDSRPLTHCFRDPTLDTLGVGLTDHGTHLYVLVEGVASVEFLRRPHQGIQQVSINRPGRKHPLRRDTHLAGVGEPAGDSCCGDLFYVGVRHDDEGAVGPQLHRYLLDTGVSTDSVADFHASGKGNLPDSGIPGDCIPHLAAGAGNRLNRFLRQSCFK